MRKRPEIPEDVFFDTGSAREVGERAVEEETEAPEEQPESAETESRSAAEEPVSRSSEVRGARVSREEASDQPRVGRPPAQEGPKVAVTLYLTEPVAHMLEEVRFLLLTEHGVRTSKSAIADFALRNGLNDLEAAAEDLRRE